MALCNHNTKAKQIITVKFLQRKTQAGPVTLASGALEIGLLLLLL